MRFKRLDLNLLVALDALLEEQKTTRAAQRLNVSQSAMSGMLARLRVYFEDELLVQVGRSMQRTPLGDELAEPVRDLLMQISTTIELRHEFDPATVQRHVRIAASDYQASVLVVPLIRRLRKLAPGITIELTRLAETASEMLMSGRAHIVIMPEQLIDEQLPCERLPADEFRCIAWNGHPLLGDTLDMDTFLACGHVTPVFGPARHPSLDGLFFRQHQIERKVQVITHDFESMAQIVVETDLLAIMPARLATLCAERYPIRIMAPPIALPPLQSCMQWHRSHANDPCHRWLRRQLADVAAAHA